MMKKQKKFGGILILWLFAGLLPGCGQWGTVPVFYDLSVGTVVKEREKVQEEILEEILGEVKEKISALDNSIKEILNCASEEFAGGYPIDEAFFGWFSQQFGEKKIFALAEAAKSSCPDVESWYQITGTSIHTLWAEYCRNTGIYPEYAQENLYEKECADADKVVLDFTGDINLAEGWSTTKYLDSQPEGIRDCISPALMEELKRADILMINNEFTFSTRGNPLPGKSYTFRANPERVRVLQELETDIVSLANNHVYDFGEEALLDTMDTLKKAEIPYVGAGRNLEEAMKPVYFIANGRKIAIVSATQIERSTNYTREATETSGGVLKTLNPDKFLTVIEEAERQSDYVIVFVHWGTENTRHYGADQTELGKAFVNAGADVIIGGHTHCLQGFDFYDGKPVVYSLGNFWFNDRTIDTGLSQVIIHTDSNQIDFRFLPCMQKGCVTSLIEESGEKQRILDFMQQISASGVVVDSEGYVTER